MLNKIWAGLIITGILFAVGQDIHDEVYNSHQNGVLQSIPFTYLPADDANTSSTHLQLSFDNVQLSAELKPDQHITIFLNKQSPAHLRNRALANGKQHALVASIISKNHQHLNLLLPELHWLKLRSVTQAAFDIAEFAVKLALGLVGVMCLWLGLMQIAEKSGLIQILVKGVQPVLHWLFPGIPRGHPAFGSISMNMAANVLGLGNAATPLGIKAMQQLQDINPDKNTASDEMCMFLALNTSSVQLLPPVTLIALMGPQISELIIPIILATSCSTITAVSVAKFYAKHRKTPCNS
ncbi:Spore maturation protein A [hydrothermal vent metagenome]|uniref:Spore maturation protein A n=1 Tax=hydrothermal vent metagenome TaxID=652676 RepID=A0A3B0XQJ2_9ZZZZ